MFLIDDRRAIKCLLFSVLLFFIVNQKQKKRVISLLLLLLLRIFIYGRDELCIEQWPVLF